MNLYNREHSISSYKYRKGYDSVAWESFRYVCDVCGEVKNTFWQHCPKCGNDMRRIEHGKKEETQR